METPVGAIIGGIQQTANGIASSVLNRQASSQAWDRQKKVMKRQVQWRANDFEKAGFNRILATGLNPGGLNAPQSAPTQFGSGGIAEGMKADAQRNQSNAQVDLMGKQGDLVDAQKAATNSTTAVNNMKVATEATVQTLNQMKALETATSAAKLEADLNAIEAGQKRRDASEEIYDHPLGKTIMQIQEILGPIFRNPTPQRGRK